MGVSGFDDRNILATFLTSYEDTFAGSWANELGILVPSDSASETYGFLGANPAMREWIGARQAATLNKTQFTIRNRAFEATMAVHENDLRRDKSKMLEARIGTFATEAGADHWQSLLVDLVNANGNCYDGQAFFSATHSFGDSGTQKNLLTATEVPSANVGTATAPTPTEMANVLLETVAYMLTIKNDKQRPVNGQARNFHVQVATAPLFSAVVQAVSANLLTGTVDNPLTGLKTGGFRFTYSLEPRLTSATSKIRVYRTDGGLKPYILQEEKPIETDLLGKGSDYYFEHKSFKLGVDAIRNVGYGLWEHAADVTLS